MAWITPFLNWLSNLAPLPSDFNRIEGNIQYLKDRGDTDRTLSLYGDVSGSTTYDDNGGMSIGTTVADNSHNHVSANISDANSANVANTVVKRDSAGNFIANIITATLNGNVSGNVSGNSGTATKLQTARTITITGHADGSASFDGSGNIEINVLVSYASFATNSGNASYATSSGSCSGNSATASYATSSGSCSGNSATSTFAEKAERIKYYLVPVLPSATDFDGIIVKRSSDDSVWIAIASNWYKLSN